MQYMLMICGTEGAEPEPGFDMAAATEAWVSEMDGRGVRLQGNPLPLLASSMPWSTGTAPATSPNFPGTRGRTGTCGSPGSTTRLAGTGRRW
jgi:hypothetical protein